MTIGRSLISTRSVAGVIGLLLLGVVASCTTTGHRVKKHFEIEKNGKVSEGEIKTALLAKLPYGSSKAEVVRFLEESAISSEYRNRGNYYKVYEDSVHCVFRSHGFVLLPPRNYSHAMRFGFRNDELAELTVTHYPQFP